VLSVKLEKTAGSVDDVWLTALSCDMYRRSAADPDQEPVYSRPHQRSRDSRNDASSRRYDNNTGHLADDEPTDDDARGQHHRRQQQQHAK